MHFNPAHPSPSLPRFAPLSYPPNFVSFLFSHLPSPICAPHVSSDVWPSTYTLNSLFHSCNWLDFVILAVLFFFFYFSYVLTAMPGDLHICLWFFKTKRQLCFAISVSVCVYVLGHPYFHTLYSHSLSREKIF